MYKYRTAFKCASYVRMFCPGSLLLLALVIRYRDTWQGIRYHCTSKYSTLLFFGAKCQITFVVCFAFLTNYRLERSLYVKLKDCMSNSVDPDETAHHEPSHLDLCCLQKPIINACGSKRVKPLQDLACPGTVRAGKLSGLI